MTRAERLKLAKAARELAGEYAEGRGPELQPWTWCGCGLARVVERAGYRNTVGDDAAGVALIIGDTGLRDGMDLVSVASRFECGYRSGFSSSSEHIPGAVVFPLLWAADELESAP